MLLLIVLIPVRIFLKRYRENTKAIVGAWGKAFPSLEKAMKEGEKDAKT